VICYLKGCTEEPIIFTPDRRLTSSTAVTTGYDQSLLQEGGQLVGRGGGSSGGRQAAGHMLHRVFSGAVLSVPNTCNGSESDSPIASSAAVTVVSSSAILLRAGAVEETSSYPTTFRNPLEQLGLNKGEKILCTAIAAVPGPFVPRTPSHWADSFWALQGAGVPVVCRGVDRWLVDRRLPAPNVGPAHTSSRHTQGLAAALPLPWRRRSLA